MWGELCGFGSGRNDGLTFAAVPNRVRWWEAGIHQSMPALSRGAASLLSLSPDQGYRLLVYHSFPVVDGTEHRRLR